MYLFIYFCLFVHYYYYYYNIWLTSSRSFVSTTNPVSKLISKIVIVALLSGSLYLDR